MAYHRYIFTEPEKEALSNERLDIRLLYISKSRYDRNWRASFIPMLSPNFFMSFTEPVFFRQKMIRSRLQRIDLVLTTRT